MRTRSLPPLVLPVLLLLLNSLIHLTHALRTSGDSKPAGHSAGHSTGHSAGHSDGHSDGHSQPDTGPSGSSIRRARTLWVEPGRAPLAASDADAFTSVFGGRARQSSAAWSVGGTGGAPAGPSTAGGDVGRWFPFVPAGDVTAAPGGYPGGATIAVPPPAAGWCSTCRSSDPLP